jgi:hypothetical protein
VATTPVPVPKSPLLVELKAQPVAEMFRVVEMLADDVETVPLLDSMIWVPFTKVRVVVGRVPVTVRLREDVTMAVSSGVPAAEVGAEPLRDSAI